MRPTVAEKRAAFRRLHEDGCFVIPNPWDAGSAVALQRLGFQALATTSAGMAWSMGRPDNGVSRASAIGHFAALVDAVEVPVNADFENAFADTPEAVSANVTAAIETGIAGLSVEDSTGEPREPLYDFALAVERIIAAREAIDASGADVLLTARSEGFIAGRPDLHETVRRLVAFSEAGADCLYAPGLREEAQIVAIVEAVAPKPVNVLTLGQPVSALAALGARRISVGGSLARAAWGEFLRAAREIAESGTFSAFARGASGAELNQLFAARQERQPGPDSSANRNRPESVSG